MASRFRIGNIWVDDLRGTLPTGVGSYPRRDISAIRTLAAHHTAAPQDQPAEEIALYHINNNGWPGIGYHFVVHQDGVVEYVQDHLIASYHVGASNTEEVGICLTGDFMNAAPNAIQTQAAIALVGNYRWAMGWLMPLHAHRALDVMNRVPGPTSCPGDTYPSWLPEIDKAGRPVDGGPPPPLPPPQLASALPQGWAFLLAGAAVLGASLMSGRQEPRAEPRYWRRPRGAPIYYQ